MLSTVAIKLLEGAFICESTAPEAFRWLRTEHANTDVSSFLEKVGRRLTTTPNGQAYYAAWRHIGQEERSEVKRIFANIKHVIRPVIHFITMCMELEKRDSAPVAGDRFEYPLMLRTVTENSHLIEMLREFGTMSKDFTVTDASAKGMLDKVVQQMERWGYLVLINREQGSYRFTGKLDYYYQVVDFLMENEKIADPTDQDDGSKQGRLV